MSVDLITILNRNEGNKEIIDILRDLFKDKEGVKNDFEKLNLLKNYVYLLFGSQEYMLLLKNKIILNVDIVNVKNITDTDFFYYYDKIISDIFINEDGLFYGNNKIKRGYLNLFLKSSSVEEYIYTFHNFFYRIVSNTLKYLSRKEGSIGNIISNIVQIGFDDENEQLHIEDIIQKKEYESDLDNMFKNIDKNFNNRCDNDIEKAMEMTFKSVDILKKDEVQIENLNNFVVRNLSTYINLMMLYFKENYKESMIFNDETYLKLINITEISN
ncbi:MAG: hypothetical protein KatS3mg096_608 [Candidatus Parcubacteria bacterium]|nr:MAG: hypothetical protein KatS3mg096_608 [Candidatus Parcubacteria bacterium]